MPPLKWAYGITTHPSRRDTLLPRTIASLKEGGFDKPRLFVDAARNDEAAWWERTFGLETTVRNPCIRTFGNWVLGMWELYVREPYANFYAMFQDDLVAYKNLRQYLERCEYPIQGYWNLYTFPENMMLVPKDATVRHEPKDGWFPSNQRGRGAVGLVFNLKALQIVLGHDHMLGRPQDAHRGHRSIDGGIITALRKSGWKEYVHNPSLVQHTGKISSMDSKEHPQANTWRGEQYDATKIQS